MKKEDFLNGCFCPSWTEKETTNQRKSLATLLGELEDIKQNLEFVTEKQLRLTNLLKFYSKDLSENFS